MIGPICQFLFKESILEEATIIFANTEFETSQKAYVF